MSAEDGVPGKDFYGTSSTAPLILLLRRNPFIFLSLIEQFRGWFSILRLQKPNYLNMVMITLNFVMKSLPG